MKVAISGVHGTGKTTLFRELRSELKDRYLFVEGITRYLNSVGISINQNGDSITQAIILTDHWRRIQLQGNIFYERCILDGYVYTKYLFQQKRVSSVLMNFAEEVLKTTIKNYDHIFYIRPEFKVNKDGVRSIDLKFRDDILNLFEGTVEYYNIQIKLITGSVTERVKQVLEVLK